MPGPALWLVLAGAAGAVLGSVFCQAGRPDAQGAAGTAAAVGLLIADAVRRGSSYPAEAAVVGGVAVVAAVLVAVTVRSWRQLALVAGWTVPCALAGYVLVPAPDLRERVLVTGGP